MRFHISRKNCGWRKILSMELRKMLRTKAFWISLALGLAIVTLNTLYIASPKEEWYDYGEDILVNPMIYGSTLYNCWIGNESFTFAFSMFYFLFPILCILPYGWSLCAEMQNGYLKNIAVRVQRKDYFKAKYGAAFLGGGLAGTIPLVVNFVVDALFLPAIRPDLLYPYYSMQQVDFLAELYCVRPLLFNLLYFAFSFVYFGLIAGCTVACAFLVKSRILGMLLPVGVFYVMHSVSMMLPYPQVLYELSPIYCIHPTPVARHANGWILFGYMAWMFLFAVLTGWIKGNEKYEIF